MFTPLNEPVREHILGILGRITCVSTPGTIYSLGALMKKFGVSVLLAAAIAAVGVAAPANATPSASNGGGNIAQPLVGNWPY